jgi:hypothetical protein
MAVHRARALPAAIKKALKHGQFTRQALEERRRVQDLVRQSRMLLKRMKDSGQRPSR